MDLLCLFWEKEELFFIRSSSNIGLKKKIHLFSSSAAAPLAPRRLVLVRAVEPPKAADAKPGLELAKSGNSFAAVKDIEAIQEILPLR